jgi:hypothetical protein
VLRRSFGGAVLAHRDSEDADALTYRGAGASAWAGYDVWIAQQWSAGIMVRGSYARVRSGDPVAAEQVRVLGIAVLFTLLFQ